MIGKCPHCKSLYAREQHETDYVHQCDSGNTTLDQEDHFNIQASFFAPRNKLSMTTAHITRGATNHARTSRGNNAETHTTRQKHTYINFKDKTVGHNPRT
jgi:hypothetical protein